MVKRWYSFSLYYWLLFIVFLVFYTWYLSHDRYKDSEKRDAVVVELLENRRYAKNGLKHTYHYPQYQFTYKDSVYKNAPEGFSKSKFKIGDKIKIIFPKDDPGHSIIYTFAGYWLKHVQLMYCIIIGFVIFIIPAIGRSLYFDITAKDT